MVSEEDAITKLTWAEDRAPQKCDPSADPWAKSKGAADACRHVVCCLFSPFDLATRVKLSRQEAATPSAGAVRSRALTFCSHVVSSAPAGTSPRSRYFQSATNSLRASATMPIFFWRELPGPNRR